MTTEAVTGAPAPERAVVGLCHGLNDQLAAVEAYVYLLERRGLLSDMAEPLRGHLDQLGHLVRLVRSLSREIEPEVAPVATSLLAEAASELMEAYPEGPVVFVTSEGSEAEVVRCDWTRTLRALLLAGAWASRGVSASVSVEIDFEKEAGETRIHLRAGQELPPPPAAELSAEPGSPGIRIGSTGDRSATLRLLSQ